MSLALIIQNNADLLHVVLLMLTAGFGCGVCVGLGLEPRQEAERRRQREAEAAGIRSADELAQVAWQAALAMQHAAQGERCAP